MTIIELLLLLLVAGICGSIGQALTGFARGGCLVSIALGFIGAVLGTWLARMLGFSEFLTVDVGGRAFPIVWSIIGASVFVAILGFLTTRRRSSG